MPVSQTFTNGDDLYSADLDDTYTLSFLGGADHLTIWRGNVSAMMGEGDDLVLIRGGSVTAYGDAGSDRFNVYADLTGLDLYGGSENDTFFGYAHAIDGTIHGESGNDAFYNFGNFNGRTVILYGGAGNDVYRVQPASSPTLVEMAAEGIDTVQVATGASYTLGENFENLTVVGFASVVGPAVLRGNADRNVITGGNGAETLYGMDGNDTLNGKGGNDSLWGNNGNDTLDGGAGNDELHGQAGQDVLQGRAGDDTMIGGAGDDTYYVDSANDVIQEDDGGGIDLVRSSSANFTMPGWVENGTTIGTDSFHYLYGNDLNNVLNGSAARDLLYGLEGDDRLNGGAGDDRLAGGAGNDLLAGGAGRDKIDGDNGIAFGNDVIIGGLGGDWLDGGGGADRYVYTSVEESRAFGDYSDQIAGGWREDLIDLSRIDANASLAGNQAFVVVDGPTGQAGELWFTYIDRYDSGFFMDRSADIWGDVDGDGVADLRIHIDGGLRDDDWNPTEFPTSNLIL